MKRTLAVCIATVLSFASGTALAINDLEANASIPFSFANPGARSLGMGGAFIGLADDATAAYSNPAGLTQLRQVEVAAEARHTAFSTPYVDSGNTTTNPFSTAGLRVLEDDSSTNNLSYFSIIVPAERWSFAFYRHELANFSSDFDTSAALRFDDAPLFMTESSIDLKIVNWGAAAAFRATDRVSFGFGLSRYDFDLHSDTGRFFENRPLRLQTALQDGDDHGLGWNLGARFGLSDSVSLGLTYRHAPRFDYTSQIIGLSDGTTPLNPPIQQYGPSRVTFNIPDVFGIGLSWRPTDRLVVNLDVNRVRYSELTDDISTFFDITATQRLQIEDGNEAHLGAEYTFADMTHPFSLRAGIWHDPRHSVSFVGVPRPDQFQNNVTFDELFAAQFAGGRGAEKHYAIGGGWAFTNFQLDLAADLSDGLDTYSMSGVYRF
ncbi:MAG TPA: outer membrane protein transport protein [Tahibacter sp.]|uniref:OmpP1/FadL family transporter n=1 Tax=Tahibacter sp. TaxID=2056211 RepID=UPI002BF13203|nr:outer membrane protein transport protein [Tahibacter sp.]HSX61395.1 outer membrane protein transport protein [Tahibacter sp.]